MKIIVDSGSTKTEWIVLERGKEVNHCITKGYNPNYFPISVLQIEIEHQILSMVNPTLIQEIYFYGSGCSSLANNTTVKDVLLNFFPNTHIIIEHDLLGAARGLCGRNAGIACIMGTGSNSCYYDGVEVVENVKSVGWMFGDKGSGTHIGKLFIESFLKSECPKHLSDMFSKQTGLFFEDIINKIYKENLPQTLFSQTSLFVGKHMKDSFMKQIVRKSIHDFFVENVCKYKLAKQLPINCTGSVAVIFETLLREEAELLGLTVGKIIQNPIDGLVVYHR